MPRMLLKGLFLSFSLLLISYRLLAQHRYTVDGIVRDTATGETLIGASVTFLERPGAGVTTNAYGFFSLSAPGGEYTLVVTYSGYLADTLPVRLVRDLSRPVSLRAGAGRLQEVVVNAGRRNDNVVKPITGVQKLSTNEIRDVPVLFGEKDIMKTIQLLPGIMAAGDGNTGFYVRGGAADQNLILLDEATVYNPSHLLGFFSVFNSDAIKDVTIYKGGMPAEYGGRLSSVLDIKMNDGNNQRFGVSGGIGLIASHLNLEGPLKRRKGSIAVSARRTYADLFLKLSHDSTTRQSSLYFYDLNVKANYAFDDRNTVYLSGYFGKDVLGLHDLFGINWGNATGTLRWNHIFNNRLFSNTSLIFSHYDYNIGINSNNDDITIASTINDAHGKEDLQFYVNSGNRVNFGIDVIHHTLSPGVINTNESSSFNSLDLSKKYSLESAAYVSHEWSPNDQWKINYGLRGTIFSVLGPGNFYTYDSAGNTIDTAAYRSGQIVKTYANLEPRFSASYRLSDPSSVKFSYTRNVQNLHLISNSTSSSPTDLWIPSSNNVKPEIADQVSFGYYHNFHNNGYEFSAEVYYKNLRNQIDYKNGAILVANENVESQLLFGKGRAYGLELYLKKKVGRMTGWVSYTLSRVEDKFTGINNGAYFPANQDHTHDLSLVGIFKASKKWTFSSTFVYVTGNPITWPSGKYEISGQAVFLYTQRNGYRMPDYNRLDIGATLQAKKTKKYESSWTFSVYNLYGRENPYTITFRTDPNDASKTQAVQTSLFRMVPSVTYNFKF
jgi:hypothetical protein